MARLTDDMRRVVQEQRLGYVATVCPDGTPNVSPKGTVRVLDDERLVFAEIRSPQTLENLERNPAIALNVVDPIVRRGYRFKGTARIVREGEVFERALTALEGIEQIAERMRAAVVIDVEEARPLTSPAYDLGHTEEELRATWLAHYAGLHGAAPRAEKRQLESD